MYNKEAFEWQLYNCLLYKELDIQNAVHTSKGQSSAPSELLVSLPQINCKVPSSTGWQRLRQNLQLKKKQNKKNKSIKLKISAKNPSKLNSFRNKNGYIFMTKVLQYLTLLRQRGTRFAQVTNMSYLIFLGSGFWLFCLRIAWIRTDLRDRYCASFFHSSPNSLATYWSMSSLFGPIVHRNIYLIKVMLLPVHCKHMVI